MQSVCLPGQDGLKLITLGQVMLRKGSLSELKSSPDLLKERYDSPRGGVPMQLPKGRSMEIEIFSTWGDSFYVGMNGLDIFMESGELVTEEHIAKVPILSCLAAVMTSDMSSNLAHFPDPGSRFGLTPQISIL